MFVVKDTGKDAIMRKNPEWRNNKFDNLEEAQLYANKWLGPFAPSRLLALDEKYNYSYYGDYVQIIEEN